MKSFYKRNFKLLFVYSLALFLCSPTFAQIDSRLSLAKICSVDGGGKSDNHCKTGTAKGKIVTDSPNEVEIIILAHAVNIPTTSDNDKVTFPKEYPALHLRYEYSPGVHKYTDPLINWVFIDQITANDGEVHSLYRSYQKVRVQLPEDAKCNPETFTINFTGDNRLYTYSDKNNKWEEYPIYTYAESDDIFSCKIFKETMHVCDPKLKPMELVTAIDICIPCENKELESDFEQSSQPIKMMANPFSETLDFNYISKDDSDLTVTLFSENGKTISTNYLFAKKGHNNLQIPTGAVSNGIYFLSVFDGTENHVEKVICVK